jgi:hypothetical protein
LNITTLDGWYEADLSKVLQEKGSSFITNYYKGSVRAALMAIYPEHTWAPYKFSKVGRNHWKDVQNQRDFMDGMS